jgi:hypothetical protein
VASASPVITGTASVGYNVGSLDLSGTITMADCPDINGPGQGDGVAPITLPTSGVTFNSWNTAWNGAGYGSMSETNNVNGGWGTAPYCGTDPDDVALANIIYQGSGGGARLIWNLPAADATQAFEVQVIVLNTYNNNYSTDKASVTLQGGPNSGVSLTLSTAAGGFAAGPNGETGFGLLTFEVPANSGATGILFDDGDYAGGIGVVNAVIVSNPGPTPEPATMGLLLLGGIGALLRRRK